MERTLNGPAVKAIREALGMTPDDLATRVGIGRPHLVNIETGRRQPSKAVAAALAVHLGVPFVAITYPTPTITKEPTP